MVRHHLLTRAAVKTDDVIDAELILTIVAVETVVTDTRMRAEAVARRVLSLAALAVIRARDVMTVVDCKYDNVTAEIYILYERGFVS